MLRSLVSKRAMGMASARVAQGSHQILDLKPLFLAEQLRDSMIRDERIGARRALALDVDKQARKERSAMKGALLNDFFQPHEGVVTNVMADDFTVGARRGVADVSLDDFFAPENAGALHDMLMADDFATEASSRVVAPFASENSFVPEADVTELLMRGEATLVRVGHTDLSAKLLADTI